MNAFRKFLTVQAIICAIINLCINIALGIVLFKDIDSVPLWGNPGIVMDTFATAFLLTFLTVLIVAPFANIENKKGTAAHFQKELSALEKSRLRFLPRSLFLRSIVLACLASLVFTPLMIGLLYAGRISELSFIYFVVYKASFATIISFPVSPVVWTSALMQYE